MKPKKPQTVPLPYNQTITHNWMSPTETGDIKALRDYKFEIDPAIDASFARRKNLNRESFQNPLGGYTTAGMRDSILRASDQELEQEHGQARREAFNEADLKDYARKAALAEMTAPRLVQSGQSGYNSQAYMPQGGIGSSLIQGAASIGSAALL